jgi:hypothetical protein
MSISIEKVYNDVKDLTMSEKLDLVQRIIQSIKHLKGNSENLDWTNLYGLGKGLWQDIDAQDYINQLRADR